VKIQKLIFTFYLICISAILFFPLIKEVRAEFCPAPNYHDYNGSSNDIYSVIDFVEDPTCKQRLDYMNYISELNIMNITKKSFDLTLEKNILQQDIINGVSMLVDNMKSYKDFYNVLKMIKKKSSFSQKEASKFQFENIKNKIERVPSVSLLEYPIFPFIFISS